MSKPYLEVSGGPNYKKIDAIYAFISIDENGLEGICGISFGGSSMPMQAISGDLKIIEKMKPTMKIIAADKKIKIKLVKFLPEAQPMEVIG